MVLSDNLSNAMSTILNAEKARKVQCTLYPSSKVVHNVLKILQDHHYLGEITSTDDGKGGVGVLTVNLIGRINKCGVVRPRYAVTKETYEKFEKRYLPARDFGLLVVSTSSGMMTHNQAKKKGIGGRLLVYCY